MKNPEIKIALICFDNPFLKPSEGGKKAMMTRIKSLLQIDGIKLDVYLHNKIQEGFLSEINIDSKKIGTIKQYQMNTTINSLVSRYPICVKKRYVSECVNTLSKMYYDIAIYEGEQVSAYKIENKVNAKYHILYMHDIESIYRKELALTQNKLIYKYANYLEAYRFKNIEKKIEYLFDQIWFISRDECKDFSEKIIEKNKCIYIPLPTLEIAEQVVVNNSHDILYVGDLTVRNNLLSLKWFIDNVFNKIQMSLEDISLNIVGRINDNDKKLLNNSKIHVLGYVDNIASLYNNAAYVICPILYGAGVKVKTLDALGRGQIVLTNSKGIEGTELEHGKHLVASDDIKKLIDYSIGILNNRNNYIYLAKNGLDFIKENHTISNQAKIIDRQIHKLIFDENLNFDN